MPHDKKVQPPLGSTYYSTAPTAENRPQSTKALDNQAPPHAPEAFSNPPRRPNKLQTQYPQQSINASTGQRANPAVLSRFSEDDLTRILSERDTASANNLLNAFAAFHQSPLLYSPISLGRCVLSFIEPESNGQCEFFKYPKSPEILEEALKCLDKALPYSKAIDLEAIEQGLREAESAAADFEPKLNLRLIQATLEKCRFEMQRRDLNNS